ncbi:phage tail protein [Neisseria polysaccharea]|uniref:Phage tail protein n=1 Tax=Neisseria polysaccharea TaxID=489 RepID=A0ABV1JLA1_NEIPO
MANLNETAQWETGIYQLETSDPVMGGPDGIDNRQAKQLANRTLWLKNQTEALQTATAGKAASATTVTAGNGLTGGGNLTASRTISLGQPGQITAQSQNAVQSSGHTHAIDTATTSRAGIVQLADRVSANPADANKAITTAAVNRAIDDLGEGVLGKITQANTRIDNAVALTGDQTITGAKIFQADIKVSASAAHAAADRYIRLGADATGSYAVNPKSGKVLYLKHDGNLTYDGNRVLTEADAQSLIPSGAVMYFARSTAPDGWLKANGAAVSRTAYAALFAAIGTTYGAGDGRTTFNLPDLRGEFVRGWDDGRGIDSRRALGSAQSDAIRNITGKLDSGQNQAEQLFDNVITSGAFEKEQAIKQWTSDARDWGDAVTAVTFDASRVVPTANENRPRNIALLACIKI